MKKPMKPHVNKATEEKEGEKVWVGRGEQVQGRKESRMEEVMEQKHIKLQSWGQDSQQRKKKHPYKHQENGAACLGIIHSVSNTGELEENRVNGSAGVYPLV